MPRISFSGFRQERDGRIDCRSRLVAGESASIIGDFGMLGLALRTGLTLEASRTAADTMSKVEVLIRLVARLDVAILRPKFFTRLLGITAS